MALSLEICYSPNADCSSICIEDTTGVYSAGNTGGWGAPNKTIADVNFATITLSKRNSDGTYASEYTISAYPDLPNTEDVQFCFTATEIGFGDLFTDGIYKITYEVGNNAVDEWDSSVTIYVTVNCSAKCCYQTMGDELALCQCGCDDLTDKYNEIATYYRLLQGAIQCGSLDAIQAYLDKLSRLCNSCGCGC